MFGLWRKQRTNRSRRNSNSSSPISRAAVAAVEPMEARLLLAADDPIISEFMASNKAGIVQDRYGDSSDWIEIYNPATTAVNMDGWYLTDKAADPVQWRFPAVTINPGQFLLVFASGRDQRDPASELHTNFQISADPGYLALIKPDGVTPSIAYNYPKQVPDVSYGVVMQGSGGNLVTAGAAVTAYVPTSDIGSTWQNVGYNDSSWIHGATGVGFDTLSHVYGQYGSNNTWNMYEVVRTPTRWVDAYNYARSRTFAGHQGHLVAINSDAENTFIKNLVGGDTWIGLTDDAAYGGTECGNTSNKSLPAAGQVPTINPLQRGAGFVWVDGEPFTYQKWASGQPSNTSSGVAPANYVRMVAAGNWQDEGPNNTYAYVIEYDLNLASRPTTMPQRFQALEVHAPVGTTINNLNDADNLLNGDSGTSYNYLLPYINLFDGSNDGSITGGSLFAGGLTNDFAVRFTGIIKIPTAGQYTFDVNSDDGFRLTIDGAVFDTITNGTGGGDTMSYGNPRGPADTLGVATLSAGEHLVTLTFYQRGGGAEVELSAAQGAYTAFNATAFHLVGDTASGGLALVGLSDYINTNIEQQAYNVNASAYVRIPFTVDNLDAIQQLTLRMKYDDGFVAYLNGYMVASSDSAPASLQWNSAADYKGSDTDALTYETFDISSAKQFLAAGTNVLAIQVLNSAADDPTLFVLPELTYSSTAATSAQQTYMLTATPGKLNSDGNPNLGPLIWTVARTPALPSDADDVIVTAEVRKSLASVSSVTLHYLVNYGSEFTVQMYDDGAHGDGAAGDGIYGATIPASASTPGQMVRYYITSADTQSRSSRWPIIPLTDPDPTSTRKWPQYEGYVVADPTVVSTMPVFYWFVQNPSAAGTRTGTRASVWFNGEFYDNIFCRQRGGSATGGTKFNFNKGYDFKYDPNEARVSEIDLNFKGGLAPDDAWIRPLITFETYRDAGSPASNTGVWRVQQNGSTVMFRIFIEDVNDEYLKRQGLYGDGAIYKTPNQDNPTITSATYFEKKNRDDEGYADLQAFLDGIHNPDLAARQRFIMDNFDVQSFVDYQAATVITEDLDCVQKNYFLYRDTRDADNPNGTNKWMLLPWDKHLTFGKNYGFSDYNAVDPQTHPFYGDSEHPKVDGPGAWNWLIDTLLDTPAVKQMYLRRLRTVMDEFLNSSDTPYADRYYETRLDQLYTMLMGDPVFASQNPNLKTAFDNIKNLYLAKKRQHLFVDHSTNTTYRDFAGIPSAQTGTPMITFGTVEYNPASGNQNQEYIQLYNNNSYAVDISGWKLQGGIDFTFKPGTVILPYDSIYVSPDLVSFFARTTGPRGNQGLNVVGPYKNQLSTRGESLVLSDGAGNQVSTYNYTGAESAAQKYLRITEVMYNPAPVSGQTIPDNEEFEFIELKNISTTQALDLTGITFTNGIDYTFTGGTLQPEQYILVVKNRDAFTSRYGSGLNLAPGQYTYKYLDNNGERIRLADAVGEEILDFSYKDTWYPASDGPGRSLVIIDPTAPPDSWKDAASWRPSTMLGGSPGADDPDPVTGSPWVHIVNVQPEHSYSPVDSISITFSEPVSGVDLSDLRLTRDGVNIPLAAGQSMSTTDNKTFVLNGLTSLTSVTGEYVLTLVPDGSITDSSGNPLAVGDSDTFHVSTTPLSGTILNVTYDSSTGKAGPVTITFNRPVDHFGLSDLKLSRNGGPNLLNGQQYLITSDHQTWQLFGLTRLTSASGQYILSLDPATSNITDKQGFPLAIGDMRSLSPDSTPPTVSITPVSPDPHNSAVDSIAIIFSEPVSGFDINDLTLRLNSGANLLTGAQTVTTSDNRVWYLNNLSDITAAQGSYVLTLAASGSGIKDLAGNALAGNATSAFTIDTMPPTATITPADPDPHDGPVDSITIHFSEPVVGFDISDLKLTRDGADVPLNGVSLQGSGGEYILSGLTPLTSRLGSYQLTLAAGGIADPAGNPLAADASESFINNRLSGQDISLTASSDPAMLNVQVDAQPAYSLKLAGLPAIQLTAANLYLLGGNGSDAVQIGDGQIAFDGLDLQFATLDQLVFNGFGGDDTLDYSLTSSSPAVRFIGSGSDTLNVNAGSFAFAADASIDLPNLSVNVGAASVSFDADQHLAALSIASGGSVALSSGRILVSGGLSLASGASLDLTDGTLIVQATAATANEVLAQINSAIASARNATPLWAGAGITSSSADDLHGLAAIRNADEQGKPLMGSFAGESVDANSILVKLTLNGDADLNGLLDGSDYFFIDKGFLSRNSANPPGGYRNGDFDYNGTIDGSDYFLIDKAFLSQRQIAAAPLSATASPFNSTRPIASPARRVLSVKAKKLAKLRAARHLR